MPASKQKQTIALLGATGRTGREVFKNLLKNEIYNLNIYVRNREKLMIIFPELVTTPHIQLFVGAITNQTVLQDCLAGCPIIISAIGGYSYYPDTSLRTSGTALVTALQALRKQSSSWQKPRLIWLSSSTRNERFAAARPPIVHYLIETAFQNGYNDLKLAQKALLEDPSLVSVLLVQPGVLVEEPGSGCEVSAASVRVACSYEDLGAGFVEVALERSYDELHEIGVSSARGDEVLRYGPIIFARICFGIIVYYVPGVVPISNAWNRIFS